MDLILGTNLLNRVINKMGFVLDASENGAIKVRTITGDDIWNIVDCDVIEDND